MAHAQRQEIELTLLRHNLTMLVAHAQRQETELQLLRHNLIFSPAPPSQPLQDFGHPRAASTRGIVLRRGGFSQKRACTSRWRATLARRAGRGAGGERGAAADPSRALRGRPGARRRRRAQRAASAVLAVAADRAADLRAARALHRWVRERVARHEVHSVVWRARAQVVACDDAAANARGALLQARGPAQHGRRRALGRDDAAARSGPQPCTGPTARCARVRRCRALAHGRGAHHVVRECASTQGVDGGAGTDPLPATPCPSVSVRCVRCRWESQ